MNRLLKKMVLGIASMALIALLPLRTEAAGVGEMAIAGISLSMDKYYTATNHPDYAVIQALSIEKAYGDNLGIADVINHLNIRKGPGTNNAIVGKLPKDAGCYIYEIDENGWARISSGGVKGYVLAEYLITGDEAKKYAEEVGFYAATVTTTTLNVRTEPNTESAILTQIGNTASFEVIADDTLSDEWIKIRVDNQEGYVSSEYVEVEYQLKKAVSEYTLTVSGVTGVSSLRANMVAYAKQFLGNPYKWGGNSMTNGVDCSGFVKNIYANFGIYMQNRVSRYQATEGKSVSLNNLLPGDLVFYASGGTVTHVAMYIGNGQIIHASSPRDGIMISNMYYQYPYCARRLIND